MHGIGIVRIAAVSSYILYGQYPVGVFRVYLLCCRWRLSVT